MVDILQQIGAGVWDTLLDMAPFLLFGFFMAGLLSVLISPDTVERHLGRGRVMPVVKAALFGVPLPLCSCSVIPVAASLRQHGANRAATTSFLISTPQTGVDSVFVTYSLLGLTFALFRLVAAFVSGVVGGLVVSRFDEEDAPAAETSPKSCGCHDEHGRSRPVRDGLRHGFVTLARDIARPLLWGLLIAGIIGALIPHDYFAGGLGSGFPAKLILMAVSIPLYVCATATVPIAAALIAAGVSPGAALVFLMAGPATNAATITTIWQVLGRKTASAYLAVVALTALISGEILDRIYTATNGVSRPAVHSHMPLWIRVACAVALLAVLANALWMRRGGQAELAAPEEAP